MPRSAPSTGSATLSTEKSSATMNWAAQSTNRTSRSRAASAGADGFRTGVGGVSIAMSMSLAPAE
ncbi:hypothetical protein SFUMM280S_08909 [Streptomyces fumanus]